MPATSELPTRYARLKARALGLLFALALVGLLVAFPAKFSGAF